MHNTQHSFNFKPLLYIFVEWQQQKLCTLKVEIAHEVED